MFIGKYNKSLIISYLGVICSVIGMYFAVIQNFRASICCLILAGVCDMFDGKFARSLKKRDKDDELFGIQLDSLADTIDFVCLPIVYGLAIGFNKWYSVIGYVLLAMAGIQRLCHFNVLVINKKDKGPVKFYSGLPVTSTSITYPLLWLISNYISMGVYNICYTVLTYATALLFVLNVKVPKIRGIAVPIITVIAAIGLLILYLI